ncbi:solute carrier family 22 member 7-like isoform X2 [Amblyomma americanum]
MAFHGQPRLSLVPGTVDTSQGMEFEKVLREVVGFGLFNKIVMTTALVLATANTALCYYFHILLLVAPTNQWCFVNGTSFEDLPDYTVLPPGRCQLVSLSRDGVNVAVADGSTALCPTGWRFDPSEFFTSVTMENGWVCAETWKMYAVHTAFWVGSMTGNLLSGLLADKIGRRKTALLLIAVGSTFNLLGAFFYEFLSYTVLKVFAAAGSFPVTTIVFVLVMEYTVVERRTLVAFIWSVSWTVFGTLIPWYAYLLQNWRALVVSSSAFGVVLFLVTWWVPESPSWLLSANRKQDAVVILGRITRFNGKDVSEERIDKLLTETGSDTKAQMIAKKAPSFWQGTVLMMKSPNIRRISLLMYISWFTISLCYNGTTVQLGQLGLDVYTSYSVAVASELPVNIFCIFALDALGRRWPSSICMLAGGVVCILMWLLRSDSDTWTLVMSTTLIFFFSEGYNIAVQVASEVFPTIIRGRAVLLQRMLGDVGGLLGAQVASLVHVDAYLPMLVTGCLALLSSVLVFLLPETAGAELPQTIEDGERYGKGQGLCFCPLFARDSEAPAIEQPSSKKRAGLFSFQKKLPVTRQPAVNKGFQDDAVVPTIYNTIK